MLSRGSHPCPASSGPCGGRLGDHAKARHWRVHARSRRQCASRARRARADVVVDLASGARSGQAGSPGCDVAPRRGSELGAQGESLPLRSVPRSSTGPSMSCSTCASQVKFTVKITVCDGLRLPTWSGFLSGGSKVKLTVKSPLCGCHRPLYTAKLTVIFALDAHEWDCFCSLSAPVH